MQGAQQGFSDRESTIYAGTVMGQGKTGLEAGMAVLFLPVDAWTRDDYGQALKLGGFTMVIEVNVPVGALPSTGSRTLCPPDGGGLRPGVVAVVFSAPSRSRYPHLEKQTARGDLFSHVRNTRAVHPLL